MSRVSRSLSDLKISIVLKSETNQQVAVLKDVPLEPLLTFSKEARRQLGTREGKPRLDVKQLVLPEKYASLDGIEYLIKAMRQADITESSLYLKEDPSLPFYKTLLIHQTYLTLNMDPQASRLPIDIHEHLRTIPVDVVEMKTLWEHYHPDSNIMKTFLYNTVRFMRNENVPMDRDAIDSYLEKHPDLVQRLQETEQHRHEGKGPILTEGKRHHDAKGNAPQGGSQ